MKKNLNILEESRKTIYAQILGKEFDDNLKREYTLYLSLVKSDDMYSRVGFDNWYFQDFKKYYLENDEWLDCFERFAWDKNSLYCKQNNINLCYDILKRSSNDTSTIQFTYLYLLKY